MTKLVIMSIFKLLFTHLDILLELVHRRIYLAVLRRLNVANATLDAFITNFCHIRLIYARGPPQSTLKSLPAKL